MSALVFLESWQQECCGDAVAVGDRVGWAALAADPELVAWTARIEPDGASWYEDHHDLGERADGSREAHTSIAGRVARIREVRRRFVEDAPGSRSFVPVDGTEEAEDVAAIPAAGSAPSRDEFPEAHFVGWLVTIDA